jgi:phage repressor protein C with HTH and peptisase S24 domain
MSYQSIGKLRLEKPYRTANPGVMDKKRLDNLDRVRRRIVERAAEVGTDLKALSKSLDKNVAYLHAFIWKGTPRKLDGDDRRKLATLLDVHEGELVAGGVVPQYMPTTERVVGVEYARLPVYDIKASAGRGSLVDDGEPVSWRLFEMDWIRGLAGTKLENLAVIRVAGDSMWETLHDGDHVLVDRSRKVLAQPGIFVLQLDGQLIVKRVSMDFQTRAVTIVSDNPKYPQQSVDAPERLEVVGRVVWLGRSVG